MAKEVNKEVKKAVAALVPNHEILWVLVEESSRRRFARYVHVNN
jgi:hypothetical protein